VYYVHTGRTVIFGTLRPQQWDPSSAGINCDFSVKSQPNVWIGSGDTLITFPWCWHNAASTKRDFYLEVIGIPRSDSARLFPWIFFVKRQRICLFWSLLKKMMAFLITKAVKRFKQHEKKFESKSGLPLWSTPPLFQFIPQVWRDFEILIQCFLHEWGWLRDLRSVSFRIPLGALQKLETRHLS